MGMFSDLGTQVGGIIGAAKAKKYSKKAMKAQVAAAEKGIGEVNKGWDYTQGLLSPWQQMGTGAIGAYGGLVGLGGPEQQQAAIEQLKQSPYYQSLYGAGEEAILQNASATGGLRGGNTQRSLADFGRDTLSQTIQQQLQNLAPGMQYGYGATGAGAQYGTQHSADISNLYLGEGQAKAADYMRRAAATNAMWQGIGGAVGGAVDMGMAAIGGGGGFGAIGAGGAPFNWAGAGNAAFGVPGLFGGGGGGAPPGGMSYNLPTNPAPFNFIPGN